MSSIRDIMDIDVEPLDSQAYRRQQAAQQLATLPSADQPSATPSPSLEDNNKGKAPIKRRRSDRVSKPNSGTSTPGPNTIRRRSSAAREAMDFQYGNQTMGVGSSTQASLSGSPPQSSRGSEQPTPEVPVKYTPVTGRISRAKKGVPVHTCDICRPVKTFTRAEHLRRHQLSHQKPAYPCTFQDCERAFHRPDLLARHLHRHETQGEKAYKSTGSRSRRASSSASESRTPPLKVETPSQNAVTNQTSPSDSITPKTSGGAESSTAAFSAITSSFSAVNFSPVTGNSHKRSASEAQLPGAGPYSPASPSSSQTVRPPTSFDQITSSPYQPNNETNLANGDSFGRASQSGFGGLYFEGNSPTFPNFGSSHSLPLLRIPEETYTPGLSHTQENSPWCSSASDSTYSTQSEGSRNGRLWAMRGRAHSINTTADWSATIGAAQWSPLPMTTTPQDLRSPGFDSMLEHYETPYSSPRMTPPTSTRQLLDVPNSFGGYYMESVGTPALPTYNKPLAQIFSASPTRISDPGLAGIDRRKDVVESQSLGSLGTLTISSPASYQTQLAQLDGYISSYWQFFDICFPIVHRGTFDPTEDSLLSSAMAAMGTQFHDTPEARQKGVELNEYCRKSIGLCLNWNLNTMRAILLTEIFTRFRARKTNIETSHHFKELYTRLLNNSSRDQTPFSTHSSNVTSNDALLDPFSPHQTSQNLQQQSGLHSDWIQWAENEGRQRLLASCFMFDIHQSIYHEQKRSDVHMDETASLLCLPCPDNIWNASTAEEWQVHFNDCTVQHLPLVEQDLSSQYVVSGSPFSQCLFICSLATRLPVRDDLTYPNVFFPNNMDSTILNMQTLFPTSPLAHSYLALNHTPLHDLLAIAGDTWVFGKKITPPEAFHSAQSRLKQWSSTLAAAAATQHACHVISTVLQPQSPEPSCVSDYWALYTAALICWAFGHRYSSSGAVPGSLSRTNSATVMNDSMEIDSPLAASPDEAKLKALKYVNGILELGTEDLLTSKAGMRGDTVGVIDAVRSRLETEGVGSKCMMIVDAIMVLTRIKEGGRGKWF